MWSGGRGRLMMMKSGGRFLFIQNNIQWVILAFRSFTCLIKHGHCKPVASCRLVGWVPSLRENPWFPYKWSSGQEGKPGNSMNFVLYLFYYAWYSFFRAEYVTYDHVSSALTRCINNRSMRKYLVCFNITTWNCGSFSAYCIHRIDILYYSIISQYVTFTLALFTVYITFFSLPQSWNHYKLLHFFLIWTHFKVIISSVKWLFS